MVINVPAELRAKLTGMAPNTFGNVFESVVSIDLSGITYSFGPPVYNISSSPMVPKVQYSTVIQNCHEEIIEVEDSLAFTFTRSFSWTIVTELSFGSEISAEVGLPADIGKISGKRTFGMKIGASRSDTNQETLGESVKVKFNVKPCKQVRVDIYADEVEKQGTITIPVRARGYAIVKMMLDSSSLIPFDSYEFDWRVAVDESWSAQGKVNIKDAVNARFVATLLNAPAICDEGPCAG